MYLVASLEVPFSDIKQAISPFPTTSLLAEKRTDKENVAKHLLRYLRAKGKADQLFKFLTSARYDNENLRPVALLLYFSDYKESLKSETGYVVDQAYQEVRLEHEFRALMLDEKMPDDVKRALAFSASIVLGSRYVDQINIFSRHAAKYFWNGLDLARGGTPNEGSIESFIYSRVFHYNEPPGADRWMKLKTLDLASKSLRDALLELEINKLDFDNIRLIIYAYAESETVGPSAPYLMPTEIVDIMRAILNWANTPQKRAELSMELGSLGGDHLFRNLLPSCLGCSEIMPADEIATRCRAARRFGEMMAGWYSKYYVDNWYIPKFFYSVLVEFPDLGDKIDRQKLGFGGPDDAGGWAKEQSRGCRSS